MRKLFAEAVELQGSEDSILGKYAIAPDAPPRNRYRRCVIELTRRALSVALSPGICPA